MKTLKLLKRNILINLSEVHEYLRRANQDIVLCKDRDTVAKKKLLNGFALDVYKEFKREGVELVKFMDSKKVFEKLAVYSRKEHPELYEKSIKKSKRDDTKKINQLITGWDKNVKPERMEEVQHFWDKKAGNLGGDVALNRLGIQLAFDLRDPLILDELMKRGTKVTGMLTKNTLNDFRDILARGYMKDGMSPYAVKKNIKNLFAKTYKNRSWIIARTETGIAQGTVQHQAYQKNKVKKKQWMAIVDKRTRPSHVSVDGQVRKMDEPFDVGGIAMMHPHDGNAPASEVISCRCDEVPIIGDIVYCKGRDTDCIRPWTGGEHEPSTNEEQRLVTKFAEDTRTLKTKFPKNLKDEWLSLYNSNSNVKDMIDNISFYTQGQFKDIRRISTGLDRYGTDIQALRYAKMIRGGKLIGKNHDAAFWGYFKDFEGFAGGWKGKEEIKGRGVWKNLVNGTKMLHKAIASSEVKTIPVYRGISRVIIRKKNLEKLGDKVSFGITSFTRDVKKAEGFAFGTTRGAKVWQGQYGRCSVIYDIKGTRHGINVSPLSPWAQQEEFMKGTFEVTKVDISKARIFGGDSYKGEIRISLKEISPNARKIKNSRGIE